MNETVSPKRRWLQFRLRTLLIAVLVLSLPLSWFAVRMEKVRRQREAVAAIERLGGYARYESEFASLMSTGTIPQRQQTWLRSTLGEDFFENVVHVNFHGIEVADADLEHLKKLTNLECLGLVGTQITDTGLVHIKKLTYLKYLDLLGTHVADAGPRHLERLNRLERLLLGGTYVTDTGMGKSENYPVYVARTSAAPRSPTPGLNILRG